MTARLSTHAKQVRGTHRADRKPKPSAMHRLIVPPPAPDHLSERAKAEWGALAAVTVEIGVLTGSDLRALALLSEVLATESELRDVLKMEGLTIAGAGRTAKVIQR